MHLSPFLATRHAYCVTAYLACSSPHVRHKSESTAVTVLTMFCHNDDGQFARKQQHAEKRCKCLSQRCHSSDCMLASLGELGMCGPGSTGHNCKMSKCDFQPTEFPFMIIHCNVGSGVYMQLQKGASAVRDMVMVLIGRKIAPQRTWLPLLFHTIPVMESTHPPVFSHTDTQRLLSRLQVLLPPLV